MAVNAGELAALCICSDWLLRQRRPEFNPRGGNTIPYLSKLENEDKFILAYQNMAVFGPVGYRPRPRYLHINQRTHGRITLEELHGRRRQRTTPIARWPAERGFFQIITLNKGKFESARGFRGYCPSANSLYANTKSSRQSKAHNPPPDNDDIVDIIGKN